MCGIAGFVSNEKENNINLRNLGTEFLSVSQASGSR